MSRLAGFYIIEAIDSAAGGTRATAASRRRASDHGALDAPRTHDHDPAILQRVAAAVRRIIGGLGRADQDRRRLDHLRVPPPEPARQPASR